MGDRGNVYIDGVYLYTHWGGSRLYKTVKEALDSHAGRGRWDDAPYLARIIFSRMIRDDVDGEFGYGISSRPCDNEHHIIVIDCEKQRIHFEEEGDEKCPRTKGISFEAFCKRRTT